MMLFLSFLPPATILFFQQTTTRKSGFPRFALQVQALGGHDISPNLLQTLIKLLRQVIVAHDLCGLGHLSQELFKTAEDADK